jgi:hypothetical protein
LVDVEAGEHLTRELDWRRGAGGDEVAVGHGRRIRVVVAAAVADGGEVLGGVAGMAPVVEQPLGGQPAGGAADGSHRDTSVEELARLPGERRVAAVEPGVRTGQDEHGAVLRAQLAQRHVGRDPDSAHGRHRLRGLAHRDHGVAPRFPLPVLLVYVGGRESDLPIGQRVVDRHVHLGRLHVILPTPLTAFCLNDSTLSSR